MPKLKRKVNKSQINIVKPKLEKFGTLLGTAIGNVQAYSSDYDSLELDDLKNRHIFRNYVDGIFTGYKWQCVEFARRWMYLNKGYVFDDIAMAYDIFKLKTVRDISTNNILPLKSFRNGSKKPPEPGSLLIWEEGGDFKITGHVAIILEVTNTYVRIAEQNFDQALWQANRNFSRELKASIDEYGGYWIACEHHENTILGWVIQTADDKYAEKQIEINQQLLKLKMKSVHPPADTTESWLNVANPDEAAYVKAVHGQKLATQSCDQLKYICLSQTAYEEIRRASNELHNMFMHATHLVLQDDNLFEKFMIPRAVWPKIQNSWANARNQMITGRFDFCLSERGIKLYEYNADSSACYMEAGKIQGKWAEHYKCHDGEDSGEDLFERLMYTWQDSDADGLLHILMDDHPEEHYHALFMKLAIEEAGIKCKIIHGVNGLSWNDQHHIVDDENNEIKWVWKTWSWETALDQIRKECEEDEDFLFNFNQPKTSDKKPRLVDVLLKDSILVYEPLWTLITSNKAILPILWQLYPNHPYLLNSQFELNNELIKTGYVTKPIAGRAGSNIHIFDQSSILTNRTEGKFSHQNQIYQELCPLPTLDDEYKVQISAFTVAGSCSGACARVDKSYIVTSESDVFPLRIVDDSLL